MTLNGRYAFCSRKDASFGAHHKKNRMKKDPFYQRQKNVGHWLWFLATLSLCGYSQGFSGDGASNDSGVIQNVDVRGFWTLCLRHLSPFQWPQNIWPWMTLAGYLAFNSVFASVWLAETARIRKIIAWKLIKIDSLSAVQISGMDSSFWRYKVCADIRSASLERRR